MSAEPDISIADLSIDYRSEDGSLKRAVQDVTLNVFPGEIVCIVGVLSQNLVRGRSWTIPGIISMVKDYRTTGSTANPDPHCWVGDHQGRRWSAEHGSAWKRASFQIVVGGIRRPAATRTDGASRRREATR